MFDSYSKSESPLLARAKPLIGGPRLYQDCFKKMPCFLSVITPDLRVVEANDRFESAFGPPAGSRCHELCRHRTEPCLECPAERSFLDGLSHSAEAGFITRTGEKLPLVLNTMPLFNPKDEVIAVLEMAVELSPVRQLQSKLESLGLLIGTISHSIKGLCTGLDGGIYIVNSGTAQQDEVKRERGWAMVQRNANRLRRLVNNTLYYAKDRVPHLETAHIDEISREVLAALSNKAERLGIRLTVSSRDPSGFFQADAAAIVAALVNLVENSLDACDADNAKESHHVSVDIHGDEKTLHFEIQDNGVGMDEETRDKSIGLFYSSKGAGGTGLGLYIASQIAQKHHGELTIDSAPGEGTRITLTLPRTVLATGTAPLLS